MLQHQIFRQPPPGQPLVLAAFSFRYDAHLVPDLLENLRPAIHGFVAWDDRQAEAALSDEPTRRTRLLQAARAQGATWLLTADPDERFETGFAGWLPALLAEGDRTLWRFTLREMFSPTHYRSDGLWGAKSVLRLFPLRAAATDPTLALHGFWVADESGYRHRDSRINLYHLRMASPARRKLRRDLYAAADPERRFQAVGYDYLDDERGMQLEPMPPGRHFTPAFIEDNGYWAPDPGALGDIRPDPYETRFSRAATCARRQGQLQAHHAMLTLLQDSRQDTDLHLLAARFALEAGAYDTAIALSDAEPDGLSPCLLRATAQVQGGNPQAAQDDLALLTSKLPGSPVIAALLADAGRATDDLTAPDAYWRQFAPPDATIREGANVAHSDLATIVLGFRNQPGLLSAVHSLLAQDAATEIIVVNSGGGDVASSLAPVLARIRLITTDTPLYVGAARNIGVEASRAPFLAFLAGDCIARPGWVSGRLNLHRAGAQSVSTAVVGEEGSGLIALAANRLRYSTRNPEADPRIVSHYGQSSARSLLRLCGIFPPGLQVAEDTALNTTAARFAAPVWAPDVQTAHRDEHSLAGLVADEHRRGQRRAAHSTFRAFAATDDPATASSHVFAIRLAAAQALVARNSALSPATRRAVAATQWLASQADRAGAVKTLQTIAKANRLRAAAEEQSSLALAEEAWGLDPQDPAKAHLAGTLRLDSADVAGAETAFHAALGLAPSHPEAAAALIALVTTRDGPLAGLHQAERLALAAPTSRRLWGFAAEAALAAGQPDWAVALAHRALACAVDNPGTHSLLSRLHTAAGNPVAAAFRSLTARRLRAAAAARRAEQVNAS